MAPKYNVGDVVSYENKLYRVLKIYAPHWGLSVGFMAVYGISLFESRPLEPYDGKLVSVREGLLLPVTDREIAVWEILYGKERK